MRPVRAISSNMNPSPSPPFGLFWTIAIPEDGIDVDLRAGRATMAATDVPIYDYENEGVPIRRRSRYAGIRVVQSHVERRERAAPYPEHRPHLRRLCRRIRPQLARWSGPRPSAIWCSPRSAVVVFRLIRRDRPRARMGRSSHRAVVNPRLRLVANSPGQSRDRSLGKLAALRRGFPLSARGETNSPSVSPVGSSVSVRPTDRPGTCPRSIRSAAWSKARAS